MVRERVDYAITKAAVRIAVLEIHANAMASIH